MYSVVLATVLTTGSVAPAWGHGCCGGCYGCWGCHGCYGCCGGCYGCWGCYGCCGGCYGCCGGCWGCYGCCGGCYGANVVYYYPSYGCCGGCYGAVVPTTVVPAVPAAPSIVPEKPREKLPPPKKEASAGYSATVVIAAPEGVSVTVNGMTLSMVSAEQTFVTPDLDPDTNYSYTVKAQTVRDGQLVSKTRKVMVNAGREVRVDFSDLASAAVRSGTIANR
jgi:uncharacterized protein (TIGR03000 family)